MKDKLRGRSMGNLKEFLMVLMMVGRMADRMDNLMAVPWADP